MNFSRLVITPRLRALFRHLSTLPEHREIIMPKVSPTMTAGRLVEWKKHEGESFLEGEDIADVESDKATMPISAREDGYIARIFVQPDTPDIPLGQILAITVEEEEYIAAFKDYSLPDDGSASDTQKIEQKSTTEQSTSTITNAATIPTPGNEYTGPVGPAIKRLLNQYPQLDLNRITPTGPKGRLLKGDVLAAIEAGTAFNETIGTKEQNTASQKSTPTFQTTESDTQEVVDYTETPVSSMRRAIAKRLLQSKREVPHRYASATYTLDALIALRARLNANRESRISVNDFVIRAVALALHRIPEMNSRWDAAMGTTVPVENIDVAMAVAIDGGLITPIIPNADRLGLAEISEKTKELVKRAREGTLEPHEYEGGSFAVTNLGMYGISEFQGIINPPHSGIIAIGAGIKKATMNDDGQLVTVTQGIASLSSDARVVEEETAAAFLAELTSCLSNPENMLI